MKKELITVEAERQTDGMLLPKAVLWKDGRRFEISRVLYFSASLEDDTIWDQLIPVITGLIDIKIDDVDGNLQKSIIHIARHIAQNGVVPQFIPFEIREKYDIDKLVDEYSMLNMPQQMTKLCDDFHNDHLLWEKLYKKLEWFQQTYFDAAMRKYSSPMETVTEI